MSKIAGALAVLGVVAGIGGAALPLSTYAADAKTSPVTVRVAVNNDIAISVDTDTVDFGTINSKSGVVTQSAVVTVSGSATNYKLSVEDVDETTALEQLNEDGSLATEYKIEYKNSALTAGADTSNWAMRTEIGGVTKYLDFADGSADIRDTATSLKEDPSTTVYFSVVIGEDIGDTEGASDGIYQDQIIFTATEAE